MSARLSGASVGDTTGKPQQPKEAGFRVCEGHSFFEKTMPAVLSLQSPASIQTYTEQSGAFSKRSAGL